MASVFKAAGAEKYSVLYTDEHGKRRKKVGYPDKKRSDRLAAMLEDRAREIRDGLRDPKAEAYRDHEGISLADHLAAFERSLTASGATTKHVASTSQQVCLMLELAKSQRISDMSLSTGLAAVQALRDKGLGQLTINHYIVAVKSFSRWLWRDKRAREYHLVHLKTSDADSDRRHVRRLLSPEEAGRIIQAAEIGPDAGGLSGPDRAILYSLALGTGFRAKELKTLTPERFNLDSHAPTVTGRSCYTKNGKEAIQPLAQSLAAQLRPWLAGKPPGKPMFGAMVQKTAKMLRVDLKNAGIPYETDSGKADFHSLRGDFISYLVASGASVKTCQTLARHSDPSLTIGIYAKASLHDINGAVESLPDLSSPKPAPEALRMTGTDGRSVNATFRSEYSGDDSPQSVILKLEASDSDGPSRPTK
jgi:integrase